MLVLGKFIGSLAWALSGCMLHFGCRLHFSSLEQPTGSNCHR